MSKSPAATARRNARLVRYSVLAGVLALSTVLGLLHMSNSSTFVPVGVDALCPFGGVEALWAFIAQGTVLKRLAFSSIVLLVATVGTALVMGRAFCGQLCPLGTLQELFGRLGRKLGIARATMPAPLDTGARFIKYAVLAIATIGTWVAGSLVFRPLDPWAAYHHLTSPELWTEFSVGAIVLALTVGGSLIYERFFCRYACPMGALLGLLSRFSWFKVRRTADSCTDCGSCDAACPVGLDVSCAGDVTTPECIACGECVTSCPRPGALAFSDKSGRTISPLVVTLATAAVFFGVIGIATAADAFEWSKPTVAGEMQRSIESGSETFDTTVIKGSTTMNQIAEGTGIPVQTLAQTFGVSSADLDTPLKDLKDAGGFTMNDVRAYVADYLGVPAPEHEEEADH